MLLRELIKWGKVGGREEMEEGMLDALEALSFLEQ